MYSSDIAELKSPGCSSNNLIPSADLFDLCELKDLLKLKRRSFPVSQRGHYNNKLCLTRYYKKPRGLSQKHTAAITIIILCHDGVSNAAKVVRFRCRFKVVWVRRLRARPTTKKRGHSAFGVSDTEHGRLLRTIVM